MSGLVLIASLGLTIVVGFALAGAGAVFVRRAHPGAGYVLAAAGLITVLGTCCSTGLWQLARSEHEWSLLSVSSLVHYAQTFLAVVLAAVALAMLSRRLRNKKAQAH